MRDNTNPIKNTIATLERLNSINHESIGDYSRLKQVIDSNVSVALLRLVEALNPAQSSLNKIFSNDYEIRMRTNNYLNVISIDILSGIGEEAELKSKVSILKNGAKPFGWADIYAIEYGVSPENTLGIQNLINSNIECWMNITTQDLDHLVGNKSFYPLQDPNNPLVQQGYFNMMRKQVGVFLNVFSDEIDTLRR